MINDQMPSKHWSLSLKFRRSSTMNPTNQCVPLQETGAWIKKLIRLGVHEVIGYVSYQTRKGQFLLKVMQEKQLKHTKKLINNLKDSLEPVMLWFFSDKKNFSQDQRSAPRTTGGSLSHLKTCPGSRRQSFWQQAWSLVSSAVKMVLCHPFFSCGSQAEQQWLHLHSE